jgi:hypothetical protein
MWLGLILSDFYQMEIKKNRQSAVFLNVRYCGSEPLITHSAGYGGYSCSSVWFGALEAEFDRLTGLNGFIPIHVGGGIGVAASNYSIPQVGYAGRVSVAPAYTPAINCSRAGVGNFYRCGKSVAPIISGGVNTFSSTGRSGRA